MAAPSREVVQRVLAKHGRDWKILQALRFGADAVLADADSGWWRRKSTWRHICWENAVNKLIELLVGDPDCQVVPHHDTVSFIFDDLVLVRLKKANVKLRTSNYPTELAQLFHEHQQDLFGFAGHQRVEAVYIPNRFNTRISWAGIVAWEKKKKLWHYELTEPVRATVTKLPAPILPATSSLVHLKNQTKSDKKNEKKDGEE